MKLEPHLIGPNGGLTKRCQALTTHKNKQCGRPASEGFDVCTVHGAGKRTRVEAQERKAVGRPVTHGFYSGEGKRRIDEILEGVRGLELDLANTDEEILLQKSIVQYLLQNAAKVQTYAEDAEKFLEEGVSAILRGITDPKELHLTLDKLAGAARLIPAILSYADKLSDHAMKVITGAKNRAETKAKLAEEKALEQLLFLVAKVRNIAWDVLTPEQLDVLEDRLDREIFSPNGLEKPELN